MIRSADRYKLCARQNAGDDKNEYNDQSHNQAQRSVFEYFSRSDGIHKSSAINIQNFLKILTGI
jgi:hypothetical protein